MDNSNVMDIINKPSEKYTNKELIDAIINNFDNIINVFKNYYNESLNDQNLYTKLLVSLSINGETKTYDINLLNECKDAINNNEISDFRIYVCSCAMSTSNNYLFSSIDMTITKDYKIRVNYFDEFNHEIVKKYRDMIDGFLKDYCYFIRCKRNDDFIKLNESSDYGTVLSNYQKMLEENNKKFASSVEFNKMKDDIDKIANGLEQKNEVSNKHKTSIQYQVSNVVLFDYIFRDWYMFNQLLGMGPEAVKHFLFDQWTITKELLLKENRFIINDVDKQVTKDDFNVAAKKTNKGTIVYFFTFPDYEFTDAASKYVALALTFGKPRYFTLEYSVNHLSNTPSWVIGEFYIKDNRIAHNNYGSIDNMQLSDFVERILGILDDFEGVKKNVDAEKAVNHKDKENILIINDNGKYEYTLLGKKYEFIATKINDIEIEIEVSDYGLAQKREDGSISLLDKVKNFSIKKGERIVLRTQTTDYSEEVVICWN